MKIQNVIAMAVLVSATTIFAQDKKQENQNLIEITSTIYMLQDQGGNIGLSFGEDGIFMIDDQFARNIESTQATIAAKDKQPVQFLVNTHHHGDHTGGNIAMAKTGTVIFSQENVRKRLKTAVDESKTKDGDTSLPMITFSEDMRFHYNGDTIFVFHVHNAHTDGDAMVYFMDSNVIHTGDVFFNGRYPYIDLKNGGSVLGYAKALSKLLMLTNEDTKVIPGHGDLATVKDVTFTRDIHNQISKLYKAGKTEAEILSVIGITEKYDALGYGSGFINTERMVKTVYADVKKEND
jgi:cyclase